MRWLLDQDPNYFTLQLLADQDQDAVRRFAASTTLTEPIALIRYLRNSVVWYALVHWLLPVTPSGGESLTRNWPKHTHDSRPGCDASHPYTRICGLAFLRHQGNQMTFR